MKYAMLFLIIFTAALNAQEINKSAVDEKSGKTMLVGVCNRSAFADTSYVWWFNSEYNLYNLDKVVLDSIKHTINDFAITIVMGTWCSDSRREIPRLFKILDTLNYDPKRLTLICVDREIKSPDAGIEKLLIKSVPTIIFYKNEEERGRIVEEPSETLEKDILKIILK